MGFLDTLKSIGSKVARGLGFAAGKARTIGNIAKKVRGIGEGIAGGLGEGRLKSALQTGLRGVAGIQKAAAYTEKAGQAAENLGSSNPMAMLRSGHALMGVGQSALGEARQAWRGRKQRRGGAGVPVVSMEDM